MDTTEKRKRGAPRRGPFSGHKITFSTKITEETMERLASAAQASGMSVSQKGEEALMRSLEAEEDFQRYFASTLQAFERNMLLSMPDRAGGIDLTDWANAASIRVQRLAHDLDLSIKDVCSSHASRRADQPTGTTSVTSSPASKPRRGGRILDIE